MATENNNNDGQLENQVDNNDIENDPILTKHMDIAIEAQDGKADTKVEGEEKEKLQSDSKPAADPKAGDSDIKNADSKSKADEKGKKDEGSLSGPRDLTLPDGTVVKGGSERRFYEQLQISKQQLTLTEQRAVKAETDAAQIVQNYQNLQQSVQAAQGLPAEKLATAVRMYQDMTASPVDTLKKLLAEAIAAGYTIDGIAVGVDKIAIERIIQQNQSQMQEQQGPSEESIVQEAQAEWTGFATQFPDAIPHDALIATMLRDNPGIDLRSAYFQLRTAFADKGLDWSRPLEQQVDASHSNQQQQQQQQKPLPNGRGNAQVNSANDRIAVVSEKTDIGDIIRESMREAGMQI